MAVHPGSWFGLPDFGITEWVQSKVSPSSPRSSQGGSNLYGNPSASSGSVQGSQTGPIPNPYSQPTSKPSTNFDQIKQNAASSSGGGGGGGDSRMDQLRKIIEDTGGDPSQRDEYNRLLASGPNVDALAGDQEAAARAKAEANRQAAMRKYQAQVQIAGSAKENAKGQYDWMVETLGSNKQDLLEQVATNEKEGLANLQQQEAKTKTQYDSAKQEILTTYRDLGRQQEKLMRGAGLGSSSRQMEAQNRLNALLGKDLGQVSTNEADALAMIGNAVSSLKQKTIDQTNSIERETKTKLDEAALTYKANVDAINNNLYLAENEREDAYAAAEAQLADDQARISTWAAGLKAQVETQKMQLKMQLDQFILSMTDAKGLLMGDFNAKAEATNQFLENAKYNVRLDTETGAQQVSGQGAGYTKKQPTTTDPLLWALQSDSNKENTGSAQMAATRDPLMGLSL